MNRCAPAWLILGIVVVLGLGGAAGCGAREVPELAGDYNPRVKSRTGKAMLRGADGAYVEGIDGQRVENVDGLREAGGSTGGNAVAVPAGNRRVRIVYQLPPKPSMMGRTPAFPTAHVQLRRRVCRWEFDFVCEKGHEYEFSIPRPAVALNLPHEYKLLVTDLTRDESLTIEHTDVVVVE